MRILFVEINIKYLTANFILQTKLKEIYDNLTCINSVFHTHLKTNSRYDLTSPDYTEISEQIRSSKI